MNPHEVLEVLELAVSEGRPALLLPVASFLGCASPGAVELAKARNVRPAALAATVRRAIAELDHLEKRRGWWKAKDVQISNVWAVYDLADVRAARVQQVGRRQKLLNICRKLESSAERERIRSRIVSFLGEPGMPIDLSSEEWRRPQ